MRYGDFRYVLKMAMRRQPALWQIIAVNAGVALACWIAGIAAYFAGPGTGLAPWLSMPATIDALALRPWTPLTYMFTQTSPLHLLFNMLWLYWFGEVLADTAGNRSVWKAYVIGGITGALSFALATTFISSLGSVSLSGASAAVVAVMAEAAFRQPDREFRLFLIGSVKLKWLAAISLGLLMLGLGGGGNAGGQAAHIGGALAGCALFFAGRIKRKKNATACAQPKRAGKVVKAMTTYRTDMERLDMLLDKIKLSGYDSLTSKEKGELQRLSGMKRPGG